MRNEIQLLDDQYNNFKLVFLLTQQRQMDDLWIKLIRNR